MPNRTTPSSPDLKVGASGDAFSVMAGYKFGARESNALFDLMQTLELSNLEKPVNYLKVIKAAHKEIILLRDLEMAVFSMLMTAADEAATEEDAAHAVLSVNMAYQKLLSKKSL